MGAGGGGLGAGRVFVGIVGGGRGTGGLLLCSGMWCVPGGAFFRCVGWALFKVTVLGYCFLVGEGHWSQFRLSFDDITLLFKETCGLISPSIIPSLPYPKTPSSQKLLHQSCKPPQTPTATSPATITTIPSCFPTLSTLLSPSHTSNTRKTHPSKTKKKQPLLQSPPPRRLPRHPFFRQSRLASQAPNMRALWGELFACC